MVAEPVPGIAPRAAPALALTLCGIAANALSYVVLLVAAAALTPHVYGQLVAELGILVIATVPALAVQTVTARRVATGEPAGVLRSAVVVGLIATAATLALSVPVQHFARLPDVVPLVALAAMVPGLVVIGAAQGVWQGQRRFGALARMIAASALARSGVGTIGLLAGGSTLACLGAMAIGVSVLAVLVASGSVLGGSAERARGIGPVLRETAHAAHAHGALYLLTVLDLLLARHVLSAGTAAVYASGAVVARAALWLPQAVALLVFPALTDSSRRRAVLPPAVAVVCGAGGVLAIGTWVLADLAARVVGSGKYPELADSAWAFAILGTAAAVLQLAVVAGLAARQLAPVAITWVASVIEVVVVLSLGTSATVLRIALACGAAVSIAAAVAVTVLLTSDRQSPEQRAGHGAEHRHHRA